jgi:NAD(P)H dehydrogenase (quinone)
LTAGLGRARVSPGGGLITITGSTGRIGGLVARDLAARGIPLRLVVRDATRAPDLAQAEIRTADYADGEAVRRPSKMPAPC